MDGQTTSYLVDDRNPTGYAQVVEEIVNGTVNHTYTYGHDLISQDQVDSASNTWHASFYTYDGHGNVRFLTNESGQVTDSYVYDAYGTLISAVGSTNNRYLYTGEQFDPHLGLYYLRARLMNPLTGRFWSVDAYEGKGVDPESLHKYLYASADPSNRIDPSGHFSLSEQITVTNTVATLAAIGGFEALFRENGGRHPGDNHPLTDMNSTLTKTPSESKTRKRAQTRFSITFAPCHYRKGLLLMEDRFQRWAILFPSIW